MKKERGRSLRRQERSPDSKVGLKPGRGVGEGRASDYSRVLKKTWLDQWGVLRQRRARRGTPHGAELGQHWHP